MSNNTIKTKSGITITTEEVLNRFKSLVSSSPKSIDIETDENRGSDDKINVRFAWSDDFDVLVSFKTEVNCPDEWSILYENTKFDGCLLESNIDQDLNEPLDLDLGSLQIEVENFMVSDDFKSGAEVFFDGDSLQSSLDREYEHNNPMKAYGLSVSDFI